MECENCHGYYSGRYCKICETAPEKKKPKPIAKRSKKRAKQEREYSEIRKKYLEKHPMCEVVNCGNKASEVHHKRGRIGELLTNAKYFLAVCGTHHRHIEDNPKWSKEHGYSEYR